MLHSRPASVCTQYNNSPGLRSASFFPLRTPAPALAIRHMVPTDIAFMNLDSYSVERRKRFLSSFIGVFGGTTVASEQSAVETARAALAKIA